MTDLSKTPANNGEKQNPEFLEPFTPNVKDFGMKS